MDYTLKEIAEMCGGTLCAGSDGARSFVAVDSDSRAIKDGKTLFAAFRGDNFDGHSFVSELCKSGGALIDDPRYACPNAILADDVKKALYRAAFRHRNEVLPKLKVLAVTGSVGKTTVKNMAQLVMSAKYRTCKSKGNRNSLMGLPMEVLNAPPDAEWAVFEAGMNVPGEIAEISRLIKPAAAIITNIGHSHIEFFGSVEAICREKLSITAGMERGLLVMPDDKLLLGCACAADEKIVCSVRGSGEDGKPVCSVCGSGEGGKPVWSVRGSGAGAFAASPNRAGAPDENTRYAGYTRHAEAFAANPNRAEAFAENIEEKADGTAFTARYGDEKAEVFLPAFGLHNVQNALLCFAAGVRLGVDAERAAAALSGFVPEGMRQNIRRTNGVCVIADCYNASPESMAAALSVLKAAKGRRIAVLGDMQELGSHSASLHREVGRMAADSADCLICVGKDALYIADEAEMCGLPESCVFRYAPEEYKDAAERLARTVKAGDTVLFKASNRTKIRKVMEESGI